MSSGNCVLLHPEYCDTGLAMKGMMNNDLSSDEVHNVARSSQHIQMKDDGAVSNASNLYHQVENVVANGRERVLKRPGNSVVGVENEDCDTTTNSSSNDEPKRSTPQHEQDLAKKQSSDEVIFPIRDVDFEVSLLSQRNKRVLVSRLMETAPRGKLSMVRLRFFSIDIQHKYLLIMEYSLIFCVN